MSRGIKLSDSLPPVLLSLVEAWSNSYQSSATVSALFAGISSQLYSFFTNIDPKSGSYTHRSSPQSAITFMIFLSYATMLLNAVAAMMSFVLADMLSELPYLNATREEPRYPSGAIVHANQSYLVRAYGIGKRWNIALYHWRFCYTVGTWCLILQITTYVLMQEPDTVRIPVAILSGCLMIPLVLTTLPQNYLNSP